MARAKSAWLLGGGPGHIPAIESFGNITPPVANSCVQLVDQRVFQWSPWAFTDGGVQVIVPAEARREGGRHALRCAQAAQGGSPPPPWATGQGEADAWDDALGGKAASMWAHVPLSALLARAMMKLLGKLTPPTRPMLLY